MDDLMILHARARLMRVKQARSLVGHGPEDFAWNNAQPTHYTTPSGFVTPRPQFKAKLPFKKTTADEFGENYVKDDGSMRSKIKGFAARLASSNVGQALKSFHNNWYGGER